MSRVALLPIALTALALSPLRGQEATIQSGARTTISQRSVVIYDVTGTITLRHGTGPLWGANAEGTNLSGDWLFDTGSGDAVVHGKRGSLKFDTGSGSGTVSDMTGDVLDIDTGSGDAEASNIQVARFKFDTGSGDVHATRLQARRGLIDTGSGKADIEFSGGTIDDLSIDTGSGRVHLALPPNPDLRISMDTGGGDIVVNRDGGIFERRDSDGTVLRFGEGHGRVKIDTGSGGVTIR